MKIGIIYAMKKEMKAYYYAFKKLKKIQSSIYGINIYVSHSNKIFFIQSGIGKVSSSIACTILIYIYKVNIIINIGSSGTLKSYININDVIIGSKIAYHDVNVTSFNYTVGQIPGFPKIFNTNNFLRNQIKTILYNYNITFWEGLIVSGDTFINHNNHINNITNNFTDIIALDMESAAINQVCFQHNIPVLIIKIISDFATETAPSIFKKNIKNLYLKLYNIIHDYIQIIQTCSKIITYV
ncbi:5'-methylthioadenosine/adenosylhomocysteine nucleosidase [Buchnera aphidicola (Takecallis taiwana)]|uniref:5'-methylthioadenosine/adenosylhomocysteine nucleosidase n=1 Tax=Buchnera aphidicola TaxID=9 RepID=UPI0031B68E8D